jgi:PAS domain S-box-containing protein
MRSVASWLLDTGDFMSHGNCYLWKPALVALHVAADALIGLSYFAISLTLLYMVRRARRELPFHWIVVAFGAFIIACGCTHLMEVVTVWIPAYWVSGGIKALTAGVSLATAVMLPRLVPQALGMLESAKVADQRLADLKTANASILLLNEELEERVRARTAQLARANEQLAEKAAIVNHSNDAIFSKTLEGLITSWNPGAERMYGYTASEIVGKHVSILLPEQLHEELADILRRIRNGEMVDWMETVRVRKDGTRIDAHLSISPVCDAEGTVSGASVIARDVTDRKRTEQAIRETQKLESLGLIAGGIAHDFNNLLVGIMGNAGLVLETMPSTDSHRPFIERVVGASEKAAHLTRQMLAYAGKGRFITEKIDLSALVREMGNLVRTSAPKSVELRFELADQLPPIEGDPSQFQQLTMNLLINGAEAIGDKPGTVTVRTGSYQVPEGEIPEGFSGAALQPGAYVTMEVEDTGCGMTEEVRSKIFDPFFTTKFTGRGLGLAATLGIVRGHHGAIRVTSAPGEGSRFQVLIPVSGEWAEAPPVEVRATDNRGSGMVLVADDEEMVRLMTKASLERFGYSAITADNGKAAVELFRRNAPDVVLVLLDLTMPLMGGEEAFRQIRGIRPDVPVVISSGYSELETVRRFGSSEVAVFIQKPYTPTQLAEVVKRALQR